ncbi:hypothetical protein BGZ73_004626 [Actinomortierella ambigua]|nr:hypothetical protein BGZ73_004626 [Actinomortierella ambigua]
MSARHQQHESVSGRPRVNLTCLPMDILLLIASPRFLTIQDIEHELIDIIERLTKILLHPDFHPRLLRSSYSFRSSSVGNPLAASRRSGRQSHLGHTHGNGGRSVNMAAETIRRVRRDLQDYPIFMTGNPPDLVRLAIEFGFVPFVDHLLHRGFRPRDLPEYFRQIPILEDPRITHRCHRYTAKHGAGVSGSIQGPCAWGEACPHRRTAVEAHDHEYEQVEPCSEDDSLSVSRKKKAMASPKDHRETRGRGAQEASTDTAESEDDNEATTSVKHQSTPSLLLSPFIQLKHNLRKKSKQKRSQRLQMQQQTTPTTPEGTTGQEGLDTKGKGKQPQYSSGDDELDHAHHHHHHSQLHQPYPSFPHIHPHHHRAQDRQGVEAYSYKQKTDTERMYELHRIWECVSVSNQELVDACANADVAAVQQILNAMLIHPRQSLEERAAAIARAEAAREVNRSSMQPSQGDGAESGAEGVGETASGRTSGVGGGGAGLAMSVGMSTGASAPASVSMPASSGGGDLLASGTEDSSSERRGSTATAQTLCSSDSHHTSHVSGIGSASAPHLTPHPLSNVTPALDTLPQQHGTPSATGAPRTSMHIAEFSVAESGVTAATLVDRSTIFRQRRRLPSDDSENGSDAEENKAKVSSSIFPEQQGTHSDNLDPVSPASHPHTGSPLEPVHMPWVDGRALTSGLLAICFRRDGFQTAEAEAEEEARAVPIVAELLKYDSMLTAQALGQAVMALAYSRRTGAVKRRGQLGATTTTTTGAVHTLSVFDLVLERIGPREWLKLIKYYLQRQEFEDLAIVLERCPFKGQAMEEYNHQRGNGSQGKRGGGGPSTGMDNRIRRAETPPRPPAVESRPGEICREAGVCGVGTRLNFTGRGIGHGTVNTTNTLYGSSRILFTGNGTRFNNTLMMPRGGFRGIGANSAHSGTNQNRHSQGTRSRDGFGDVGGHDDDDDRDPERGDFDGHGLGRGDDDDDDDDGLGDGDDDDGDGHDNSLAFGGVGSSTTSSSRPGPGIVGIAIQVQAPEYILEALLDMGFRFFSVSDLSISDAHHPLALKFRQQEKMNRQLIEFCMVPNLETLHAKKLAKRRFVSERSTSPVNADPKGKGKKVVYDDALLEHQGVLSPLSPQTRSPRKQQSPLQRAEGQESDDSEEKRVQATVQSFLYPGLSSVGEKGAASMPTIPRRQSSLSYSSMARVLDMSSDAGSNGRDGSGVSSRRDAPLPKILDLEHKPLPPFLLPPIQLGESFEQLTMNTMLDEQNSSAERHQSLDAIRSTQMALQMQLQQQQLRSGFMSVSMPLGPGASQRSPSPPMSLAVGASNSAMRLQRTMTQRRILQERTRSVVREYLSSKYVDLMTVGICLHQACYNKNEHLLSVLLEHRLLIAQDALTGAVQVAGSVGWRRGLEILLLQQGDLEAELEPAVTMTSHQIHAGSCVRWDQASAVPLQATQFYNPLASRSAMATGGASGNLHGFPTMAHYMSTSEDNTSGYQPYDPSSSSSPNRIPPFHSVGTSSPSAAGPSNHPQGFSSSSTGGHHSYYYPSSSMFPPPPAPAVARSVHNPNQFHLSISALSISPAMMMTRRFRNAVVALYAACSRNDPALVGWLVRTYADIKVSHLLQGMMIACDRGWVDVVRVLVGSSVNATEPGNSQQGCEACAIAATAGKVAEHVTHDDPSEQAPHHSCPRHGRNLFRQWLAHQHQKIVELDMCCSSNTSRDERHEDSSDSDGNSDDGEDAEDREDKEVSELRRSSQAKSPSIPHRRHPRSTLASQLPHVAITGAGDSASSQASQRPALVRNVTATSMASGTGLRELREQTMPRRRGPPPPLSMPSTPQGKKDKSFRETLRQRVGCLSIFKTKSPMDRTNKHASSFPTPSKRANSFSLSFRKKDKKHGSGSGQQGDTTQESSKDTTFSSISSHSSAAGHPPLSIESDHEGHGVGRRGQSQSRRTGVSSFQRVRSARVRKPTTATMTSTTTTTTTPISMSTSTTPSDPDPTNTTSVTNPYYIDPSSKAPATPELHLIYLLESSPLFRFYFQILNSLDSCSFVKRVAEPLPFPSQPSSSTSPMATGVDIGHEQAVPGPSTTRHAARRPSIHRRSILSADETTASAISSSSMGGLGTTGSGNGRSLLSASHPSAVTGYSSVSGSGTGTGTGTGSGSTGSRSSAVCTPTSRARKQELIQALLEPLLERFSPTDVELCFRRHLSPNQPQAQTQAQQPQGVATTTMATANTGRRPRFSPSRAHRRSISSEDTGRVLSVQQQQQQSQATTTTTASASSLSGVAASDWLWPLDPDVVEHVEREARWYRQFLTFVSQQYSKQQRRWRRQQARLDRQQRKQRQRQLEKERILREMQIRLEEAQQWQQQTAVWQGLEAEQQQQQQQQKAKRRASGVLGHPSTLLPQDIQTSSFGVTSEIYDEKCLASPCSSMAKGGDDEKDEERARAMAGGSDKELPPLPGAAMLLSNVMATATTARTNTPTTPPYSLPSSPPVGEPQQQGRRPKVSLPDDIRHALQTTPSGATTIIRTSPLTSYLPVTPSSSHDPSTPSSRRHRIPSRQRWSNIWTRVQHILNRNEES